MKNNLEEKEYKVLARKYRPQRFEDLVGQEILVQILKNAIISNRIAHAYLLTGVRGVGKTTTARLIAMSLNCENRKSDSCEPCCKCVSCNSIIQDSNLDVIEMDAASKTGVDDIREIIDNVKYKPVNNKYKIFIIDEVHMLSKNAFNALLKTLEEPPPHIKFIFATTEVKKIPITIISRCQRFDLLRINVNDLTKHFKNISAKENIKIENDAISLIVRAADGSVRDGLSLLDQAAVNDKNNVTSGSIISMLGLADRANIFDLMNDIFKGEANVALKTFNKIYQSGADVIMIFDEMLKVTHFLTQIKIYPEIKEDNHIPEFERIKGSEMAENISMSSLGLIWQILFKGYQELQSGTNLYQHGEMLIIRMIYFFNGPSPEDLIKKIEKNIEPIQNNQEIIKNLKNETKSPIINKDISDVKIEANNLQQNLENVLRIHSFRQLVDLFYQKKEGMLHTYLYNNAKVISFKEGEVVLNISDITFPNFTRTIAKFVSTWTGRIWQVSDSTSNIGKTLHEEDLLNNQKEIEIMKNDSDIKKLFEKYPKAKIHSITTIEETSDEILDDSVVQNVKE